MNGQLARIDLVLSRIERLAEGLDADPDGHVLRTARELREAFGARRAVEPAVARVRDSVLTLLRQNGHDAARAIPQEAQGADYLEQVLECELLPDLRQVGFDV